jgi:hypothetical protein
MIRLVSKGPFVLTFICMFVCGRFEAEEAGYTPTDHPAIETYFKPFLDSLEFVR